MNEMDETSRAQLTRLTSPIMKRTSESYDHYYDSISAISGSTVADSEFVAQQITKYEKEQHIKSSEHFNKQSTIYNLRIDKVVIDGATNNKELEKPVKAAVNQILNDFNNSPEKFGTPRRETRKEEIKRLIITPKFCVPIAMIVVIIILLSCGLPLLLTKNNASNDVIPSAPSTTTAGSHYPTFTQSEAYQTSSFSTLSNEITTSSASTSTEKALEFKVVKRDAWLSRALEITGKYKQLLPIKRIIILNTRTDSCYDESSCICFIIEHQQNAYPDYDDVRENFFIDMNGVIYEGRGFPHEGQAAFESLTSYNNKAVSISFILHGVDEKPNERQQAALCIFIEQAIDDEALDENYLLFQLSDLTASFFEYREVSEVNGNESCNVSTYKPPKIVKRRDWNAPVLPSDIKGCSHRISTKVIVQLTRGPSCVSIEECETLINNLTINETFDKSIEYNFFIGGNDLILEDNGFDVSLNEYFDTLWIAFLGEVETVEEGEKRSNNFNYFLKYAIDLGKVSANYKLFIECQNPTEDILYQLLKNHSHFEHKKIDE